MIGFKVTTMRCGGCAARITRAIGAVDPRARIEIDVANRTVSVEPATVDAEALAAAIRGAGHEAVPLALAT